MWMDRHKFNLVFLVPGPAATAATAATGATCVPAHAAAYETPDQRDEDQATNDTSGDDRIFAVVFGHAYVGEQVKVSICNCTDWYENNSDTSTNIYPNLIMYQADSEYRSANPAIAEAGALLQMALLRLFVVWYCICCPFFSTLNNSFLP